MAYVGGNHNTRVTQVARRFFTSSRTICNEALKIETLPPSDNHRLRAASGIGEHNISKETIKGYIDIAAKSNSWAILVFHYIGDGDSSMYCSESDFREIIEYAMRSNVDIMNIDEVYKSRF